MPFGLVRPKLHDEVLWVGEEVVFVVFVLDQILFRLGGIVVIVVAVVVAIVAWWENKRRRN